MNLSDQIGAIVQTIRLHLPEKANPKIGMVLGSGWGSYGDTLENEVKISYQELGFPVSEVIGHANYLVYGKKKGMEVLVMQGRVHSYSGHDLQTVVLPIRSLIAAGCNTIILTNAAGGIQRGLKPGMLVVICDHINFLFQSPLRGENDPHLGPRFPDMTTAYDVKLQSIAKQAGRKLGLHIGSGVYAGVPGPQYETPAEIQMLSRLGADLVGMSTVPETIAARHMGARVLAISCVSNLAAGFSSEPLTHDEVTETAEQAQQDFIPMLDGILEELAKEEQK